MVYDGLNVFTPLYKALQNAKFPKEGVKDEIFRWICKISVLLVKLADAAAYNNNNGTLKEPCYCYARANSSKEYIDMVRDAHWIESWWT